MRPPCRFAGRAAGACVPKRRRASAQHKRFAGCHGRAAATPSLAPRRHRTRTTRPRSGKACQNRARTRRQRASGPPVSHVLRPTCRNCVCALRVCSSLNSGSLTHQATPTATRQRPTTKNAPPPQAAGARARPGARRRGGAAGAKARATPLSGASASTRLCKLRGAWWGRASGRPAGARGHTHTHTHTHTERERERDRGLPLAPAGVSAI